MQFERFSFGSIQIDGVAYDHDVLASSGGLTADATKAPTTAEPPKVKHKQPRLGVPRGFLSSQRLGSTVTVTVPPTTEARASNAERVRPRRP
jgi:hypothetical protein